jgi:malate dehydrogenase (oxaloacetate-decarboxylating)(NADP+)
LAKHVRNTLIFTPSYLHQVRQKKITNIYETNLYVGLSDGLYITLKDIPQIDDVIAAYKQRTSDVPDITVVTDGSRILGLGDLGMNGMPISMGKLQLYVAGAGIDPRKTLPIVLDFGTNNEKNLADEFYLGVREKRPDDKTFYAAVDRVLKALTRAFPQMLVQFEDFSSEHAFGLLKEYQNKLLCFNDDIQGTGAVILSGLINAFRKVSDEVALRDHRIVFYGAGSAAIGVAKQIQEYLEIEHGLSEEDARNMFYICDSKGLVTMDRGDRLAEHKVYYARRDNEGSQIKGLQDIIKHVKPTTLIGLSSDAGAFNFNVLNLMSKINKQPIVFPLSNPSIKAECNFEDAMKATNNSVVFASGTAFPPYVIPETQQTRYPGQGNNMYMFPGLGLGSVLARPESITNRIILRASMALADSLTEQERENGLLYPELSRIRDVSATVASAVVDQAVRDNIATSEQVKALNPEEYQEFVKSSMWSPSYIEQ